MDTDPHSTESKTLNYLEQTHLGGLNGLSQECQSYEILRAELVGRVGSASHVEVGRDRFRFYAEDVRQVGPTDIRTSKR